MTKKKNTRRALFMSVISLILCCAMLMGTTFAWFTDSVTSGVNQINAGNLDVELYHTDKAASNEKVTASVKLFDDVTLWEPGAVAYENLQIANEGTLALKYQMALTFANATQTPAGGTLADVLKVAVVEGGFDGDRAAAQDLTYGHTLSTFSLAGQLAGDSKSNTYGVVIYWEPTDNDNAYNMNNENQGKALSIDLGIQLNATQLEYESDSFGTDYDETASMKTTASEDGSATLTAPSAPSATTDNTTIEAPAGAFPANAEVEVVVSSDNSLFNVSSEGAVIGTLDVTLLVDGEEYSAVLSEGKLYTVKTYISTGLTEVAVTYTGTDGKDQPTFVSYDSGTGLLVFTTNHFSEYAVTGKAYGYTGDTAYGSAEAAAEAIVSGVTVNIAESDKEAVVNAADEETRKDVVAALATVKIGNNNYLTLAEAMNDVATNGSQISNVTLLTDTTVEAGTVKVPTGAIVKLDLNGKKLSAVSNAAAASCAIDNKGVLTIMNGTVTYNGVGDSNFGYGTNTINNSGKLTVEGATIINTTPSGSSVAIDNTAGATLIIDSGRIESEKNAIRLCPFGDAAINCTINDGTITGARAVQIQLPSDNPESAPEINLTVNGGTLNGTTGLSIYSYSAGQSFANVKIMLKGGTYNNEVAFGGGNAKTTQETVSISENSCVFNADVYRYLANDGIQYLISDGTIDSGEELNMVLAKDGNVVLTNNIETSKIDLTTGNNDISIDAGGNTITTTDAYGVEVTPGKNITLSNANVKMTKEGDYITYAAGFKIANGDYEGATITLKNCSISMANGDWAYAVNMPASVQNLNLVIENCTLEGAIAVQCWGDNNTIRIIDSELICSYNTYENYTSHCVALQGDGTNIAENNTLVIENCEFSYTGTDNYNSSINAVYNNGTGNTITVTNCTYGEKIVAPNP